MNWFSPVYNTVVGLLIGALVTFISTLIKEKKDKAKNDIDHSKNIEAGVAILLRTQLMAYYSVYQDKTEISASDWEDITSIYAVYKKLGGNHMGDKIYQELSEKTIHKYRG